MSTPTPEDLESLTGTNAFVTCGAYVVIYESAEFEFRLESRGMDRQDCARLLRDTAAELEAGQRSQDGPEPVPILRTAAQSPLAGPLYPEEDQHG